MCPNLYDEVSSKILPIIQGAKNVAQIPKNDKVPQIVLKDLSPKHSVIFKAIIAPNPAKPIPKIIMPSHITIMFPWAKRIIERAKDCRSTETQVKYKEEYFSLNLPKIIFEKIPIAPMYVIAKVADANPKPSVVK